MWIADKYIDYVKNAAGAALYALEKLGIPEK